MAKKMLIDATHAEETRVVVVDGNKVDEFDFESVNKRQLAGNIYLAKVTRVEPSLQAAFVDYGGNRHGFLAFSEIHPDYYQIPVADRQALLAEERAYAEAEEEEEAEESKKSSRSRSRRRSSRSRDKDKEKSTEATTETRPSVEGMDVVEFDDAENEAEDSDPLQLIEDEAPRPKQTRKKAKAEASKPEAGDSEQAEAAEATEVAEDAAQAESAEAGATAETESAPAEEAVVTAEAETEAEPEVAENEVASAEDAESDEPETPRSGTIAARIEDDEDDVVTSGEVDAEGDASTEPETAEAEEAPAVEDEGAETADAPTEEQAPVEAEAPAEPETAAEADAPAAEAEPEDAAAENADAEQAEDEDDEEDEAQDGPDPKAEIESVAEEDVQEEIRRPRKPRMRRYKIQEVIKVRQIMLVQVVKEERGNKGAALTTYLSLAGRYCVLMPNTARGGGISRKITNASDRKKLKEIAGEIDVPEGAGLIIRTAGAKRTKAEIKRDYEYLKRLWEQIRELTLKSIAPAPIYEEGNLIKRSIRDLYNRDIDEVLVEGEHGYRVAKDFMKMIMPSHAKNVRQYTDTMPLFARYQVESYLAAMFNPTVQLKSGGYIVIGVTEALVAIDVNSGRATKEGSIEETALKTNLEAAEEVARQLRLRDLAGLIVIDFIDMEERKNNAAVEKRFKDKLKTDRARIQVGRISGFGLLEMSRQRLRPGMLEATTQPCPHCHGTGLLRSSDSIGLQILRQLEEEGGRRRSREVLVKVPPSICNFLINQKREHIAHIESQYGMAVRIESDPALIPPDFSIEKFKTATRWVPEVSAPVISIDTSDMPEIDEEAEDAVEVQEEATTPEASSEDGGTKKKRRRRRRRKGSSSGQENGEAQTADSETTEQDTDASDAGDETSEGDAQSSEASGEDGDEQQKSSRSRRRRRSRSRSKSSDETADATTDEAGADATASEEAAVSSEQADAEVSEPAEPVAEEAAEAPAAIEEAQAEPEAAPEPAPVEEAQPEAVAEIAEEAPAETPEAAPEPEPVAEAEATEAAPAEPEPEMAEALVEEAPQAVEEDDSKPKRRGWWSVGR
ncbi:Rne/Rng family ribonuclease [Tropicimonas sediminicola]|uniref:Ribonuclease E n=1 Tax=Tropicimonas sediminicola TaxID=1031541 RepID=A0A239K0T0_9RHOB|nr:ribonuclease E/G [Tropicimonas sediminicola]SNT10664.1 RNAse E [Tropicimonas sediminicola]